MRGPRLDVGLGGEQAAMRPAAIGPLAHQFERALGDADIAHAMMDTAWAEPRLCNRKAVAFAAEHIRGGDTATRGEDFPIAPAPPLSPHPHRPHPLAAGTGVRDHHQPRALLWPPL